ncbi:hypothetical protein HF086_000270 [Spodoptera exigua]|uniref:Nucleolar autoantigen 36 n=1 Tax=Spodoptera exigua TaxID=7107 RepID=A0A922M8K3_SPOEX|nr:hypothetical protein HF086_000270 [Spodoptera exigua]
MPKKKTGQRKKAEKQKLRQKEIRNARENVDLAAHPCNIPMECDKCQKYLFVYITFTLCRGRGVAMVELNIFDHLLLQLSALSNSLHDETEESGILLLLPGSAASANLCALWQSEVYAEVWRLRCASPGGLHYRAGHGAPLLCVQGAICDFCEAWVCHGRKCLTAHACTCPLMDAVCLECERGIHKKAIEYAIIRYLFSGRTRG